MKSKRTRILLADALLVAVTVAEAARSGSELGWAVVLAVLILVGCFSYIYLNDRRLASKSSVPEVHFQIPVVQLLREPLVSRQFGDTDTKWITLQASGYFSGRVVLDRSVLRFQPDWIARKGRFTVFEIPVSAIAGFERIRLAGEIVDAFSLSIEHGSILRFEMRQANLVEARLRDLGLSAAERVQGLPPTSTTPF